jgi:hypothetical protein
MLISPHQNLDRGPISGSASSGCPTGILRRRITSTGSASRHRHASSTSSLPRPRPAGSASGPPGPARRARMKATRSPRAIIRHPPPGCSPRGRRPERLPPAHCRLAVAGRVRPRPRLPGRTRSARARLRARRSLRRRPTSVNRRGAPARQATNRTAAGHGRPLTASWTAPGPRLRLVQPPLARTTAHCPLCPGLSRPRRR